MRRVQLESKDAQEEKDTVVLAVKLQNALPDTPYVGGAYLETEIERKRHSSTLHYSDRAFVLRYAAFRTLAGQTGEFYFEKYFLEDGALSRARHAHPVVVARTPDEVSALDTLEIRKLLVFNAAGKPIAPPNENVTVVNVVVDSELHVGARLDARPAGLDVYARFRDSFHSCVVTGHPYSFVQCFLKAREIVGLLAGPSGAGEAAEPEFLTAEEKTEILRILATRAEWEPVLRELLGVLFVSFPTTELRALPDFQGAKRELRVLSASDVCVRAVLRRLESVFALPDRSLEFRAESSEGCVKSPDTCAGDAAESKKLPATAYQRLALAECLAELRAQAFEDIPVEQLFGDKLRSA